MQSWTMNCKFIGEGKSIFADVTQDDYDRYAETSNAFDACFHDIGLFLDVAYNGKANIAGMELDIKYIILDFLKKTSSFRSVIAAGLPYAAFTFFRSHDWTEDAPNYRYRFLGAYKDQHSDHKLWAGNRYFIPDDYHAESYVHQYQKAHLSLHRTTLSI